MDERHDYLWCAQHHDERGVSAASAECADKVPAGGFILVPPPEAGQYQFAQYTAAPGSPGRAQHRLRGATRSPVRKVTFTSRFAGTYNMTNSVVPVKLSNGSTVDVQPLTTGPHCTWLITGGTGAYNGLQGRGRALPMPRTLSRGSTTLSRADRWSVGA